MIEFLQTPPHPIGSPSHFHVFKKVSKRSYVCSCGRILVDKKGA